MIAVATIVREWGTRGELKALPLSSRPGVLKSGQEVYLSMSAGLVLRYQIRNLKKAGRALVISFSGVDSPEEAARFRGADINIRADSLTLGENEYLQRDIIGMSVFTSEGSFLGSVTDILETGSNDVYVVEDGGREFLMPAIRDVIKYIDIESRKITIELMEGMLD